VLLAEKQKGLDRLRFKLKPKTETILPEWLPIFIEWRRHKKKRS